MNYENSHSSSAKQRVGVLFSALVVAFCLLPLVGCEHEGDPLKEDVVSYKKDIAPIISGNCSSTGCHDGVEEGSYGSYNQLMGIVTPGDSKGSELYKITTSSFDFVRMPPRPRDPLSKQQRTLIDLWIGQGAINN